MPCRVDTSLIVTPTHDRTALHEAPTYDQSSLFGIWPYHLRLVSGDPSAFCVQKVNTPSDFSLLQPASVTSGLPVTPLLAQRRLKPGR